MKKIISALLIVMLITSTAGAFTRDMTMEAVGLIEIHSVSQNGANKAGVSIQGEGELGYAAGNKIGTVTMDQAYRIETRTAEKTLRPLRAITALKAGNGNGALYIYALLTEPGRGEAGLIDIRYIVDMEAFAELNLTAEAFVSQGTFRNYIDIYNPTTGIGLREAIYILGQAYYRDVLWISEPVGEKDNEPPSDLIE